MTDSSLPPEGQPIGHYINPAPFDPRSVEQLTPAQERLYLASQWKLMWWKFKRHKIAVASAIFLAIMYLAIFISEFLAPYDLQSRHVDSLFMPPQAVHLFHEGDFVGPFVYGTIAKLNMENLKREYTENRKQVYPLNFFCRGDTYDYWLGGSSDFHMVCAAKDSTVFLLGTDRLGRDVLSRIIIGSRISLTIGLLGIIISFVLGITIGGMAGYYGGLLDLLVQRVIEVLQSLPSIPLWLALAAIIPITWSPILVYFGITVILGLLDWTDRKSVV